MISSALSSGKPLPKWILIRHTRAIRSIQLALAVMLMALLIPQRSYAIHELFKPPHLAKTLAYSAAATAGLYFVSEMTGGPAVLSILYTSGSIYLMNEWFKADNDTLDLVVPFGMLAMGVANAALLSDESYSHHEVFIYNLAGAALITGYAAWAHSHGGHPSTFTVSPMLHHRSSGVLLTKTF